TSEPGKQPVGGAPLSISVRQDHRNQLGLSRSKRDICLRPSEAGEYPLGLTRRVPARDGTTRGAQAYMRVSDSTRAADPADNSHRWCNLGTAAVRADRELHAWFTRPGASPSRARRKGSTMKTKQALLGCM